MKIHTSALILIVMASVVILAAGCTTSQTPAEPPDSGTVLEAVLAGDRTEVERLIEAGADVNAQSDSGNLSRIHSPSMTQRSRSDSR